MFNSNRRLSHVGWGEVAGGVMHANGQGVLQDGNMAVYWYGLAAYSGHALARHNLGAMIDSGRAAVRDTMR